MIELVNGIATFGAPLTVVLDDFQSITDLECLESIDYALDHLPPTTRLMVMTRSDPSLNLSRLRASGALAEVRASDARFHAGGDNRAARRTGRASTSRPDEVEVLRERTEGWPGALYLALLWLRGVENRHDAVREFGGDHRFVADYLNHEILGSLDEESRWFLLRTSVLGHFTAELCDSVFGRSDAASTLETLEHSNLFVARLEHGGWFRVHPLFAEFAEFQLESHDAGAVGGDPSAGCSVVARTRPSARGGRARCGRARLRARRQNRLRSPPAGDPERRCPHPRPLGQDAAGRAARRASRAGDGRGHRGQPRRSPDDRAASLPPARRTCSRGGLRAIHAVRRCRHRAWFGRSPSTKG